MLRINRQTDYAVRVVLALAQQAMGSRVSTKEIGRVMLIPQNFLPRIVAELGQANIIATYPGRGGGLELARTSEKITLRDVVEAFEGPLLLSECIEGNDFCPFEKSCVVRPRWTRLQNVILEELERTTFLDLAKEANAKNSPISIKNITI